MSVSLTSGGAASSASLTVSSLACALSSPATIGSIIIVGVVALPAASAPAFLVTDNLGNTYTSTGARVVQNLETVELFAGIVTVAGSVTVTATPSGNAVLDMSAFQFTSNVPGSTFIPVTRTQTAGNSTAPSVPATGVVSPPDLAISFVGSKPGASITKNNAAGWTNAFFTSGSGSSGNSFDYNLAQTVALSALWSLASARDWGAMIVNWRIAPPAVTNIVYHRIDIPRPQQDYASYYEPRLRFALPTFISTVPSRQPGQYRPDPVPDFTPWITPDIKVLPPPVLTPPIFPQPSQRVEPLPVFDFWWEQFRLQPLFTFLPTPFPRQDDQRFDALPDLFPYWEQFLRLSPPTFLPAPFPRPGSQRHDQLPELTSWWEQFTRQPIPITFLPTPFPQQGSQRHDPLPDLNSWWEQFRLQPIPITFLPTPFPQQGSQRYDQLPDFNLSAWEQFKLFTLGTGAVVERPSTKQASQRFDALPELTSWWEQFRLQPQPLTFVVTPFLRQKDQRWDALPSLVSLWWQQHPYVFQAIQPVLDKPTPRQPLNVYFEPANNFFGWWEQALIHQFPLLPPSPRLIRLMELVNRVPDSTTFDGKRRLDRFTQVISQAFNYLQMIGRLRLTGLGTWDIVGAGAYASPNNPTVFDDVRFGYTPGALWVNTLTGIVFVNLSNTSGAAVWQALGAGSGLTGTFP